MQIVVNNPGTYYFKFSQHMPRKLELKDSQGRLYYLRYFDKVPRFKVNIPDADTYTSNVPVQVLKITDIEIPTSWPTLPPPERDRWQKSKIVYNPNLNGTPVRIFSKEGIIETSPNFYDIPPVIRLFLLLHEEGHYFYVTEEYCDLWALINYLRMGYNRSMAFYALSHYLSRHPENIKRVYQLFNNIQITQKTPLI